MAAQTCANTCHLMFTKSAWDKGASSVGARQAGLVCFLKLDLRSINLRVNVKQIKASGELKGELIKLPTTLMKELMTQTMGEFCFSFPFRDRDLCVSRL